MRVKDPSTTLTPLRRFFQEVYATNRCTKCEIRCKAPFRPVVDIRNARLSEVDVLFISEAPSIEDMEYRVPFVGPTGLFFRQALFEAGATDFSIVITNALVCRPVDASKINRIPSLNELENCSDRIKVFIETLRPKRICLVGTVARDFYSRKFSEWGINIDVFIVHHPAYVMRLGGKSSSHYNTWLTSIKEALTGEEITANENT